MNIMINTNNGSSKKTIIKNVPSIEDCTKLRKKLYSIKGLEGVVIENISLQNASAFLNKTLYLLGSIGSTNFISISFPTDLTSAQVGKIFVGFSELCLKQEFCTRNIEKLANETKFHKRDGKVKFSFNSGYGIYPRTFFIFGLLMENVPDLVKEKKWKE